MILISLFKPLCELQFFPTTQFSKQPDYTPPPSWPHSMSGCCIGSLCMCQASAVELLANLAYPWGHCRVSQARQLSLDKLSGAGVDNILCTYSLCILFKSALTKNKTVSQE